MNAPDRCRENLDETSQHDERFDPALLVANSGRLKDRARFFCASIERLAADNGIDADLEGIKILKQSWSRVSL